MKAMVLLQISQGTSLTFLFSVIGGKSGLKGFYGFIGDPRSGYDSKLSNGSSLSP